MIFVSPGQVRIIAEHDPQGRTAFTEMSRDECAKAAYEMADAMLKARGVTP